MLLIILRIAKGDAWSASKAKEMMHETVAHNAISLSLRNRPAPNPFTDADFLGRDTKSPQTSDKMFVARPSVKENGFAALTDNV